jgi:hypothetical protein
MNTFRPRPHAPRRTVAIAAAPGTIEGLVDLVE